MRNVFDRSDASLAPWFSNILLSQTNGLERRQFYIASAAVTLAFFLWLGIRNGIDFPLDDAYITLHNASVLLSGSDRNYPGTSALTGATSAVHLFLVTALLTFLPALASTFAVNAFAVLVYTLGLARLAFLFGASRVLAGVIVALGLCSGFAPYHLLNGLETGLAMAAITWAIIFALSGPPSWRLPLLCGSMPFLRPELLAFSVLLMVRQAWMRKKQGSPLSGFVQDTMLVAITALPWLLWIKFETGQFVPATVLAKTVYFSEAGLPFALKANTVLMSVTPMTIVAAVLGFIVIPRNSFGAVLLAFVVCFIGAYYVQLPGALHHNHFRYYQILLPMSLTAILCNMRHKLLAGGLLMFSAILTLITIPTALETYTTEKRNVMRERPALASWLRSNLPADARILTHDAGYLAYATPYELIDPVGLKTPESIQFHERYTVPSHGARRDEAINQIALRFKPSHAVIMKDPTAFWTQTADALSTHGWTLTQLRPALQVSDYAVFKLTPPE